MKVATLRSVWFLRTEQPVEIITTTGATGLTILTWQLDLESFSSVTDFVTRFEQEGFTLDLLVENAGIYTERYRETADGWESAQVLSSYNLYK